MGTHLCKWVPKISFGKACKFQDVIEINQVKTAMLKIPGNLSSEITFAIIRIDELWQRCSWFQERVSWNQFLGMQIRRSAYHSKFTSVHCSAVNFASRVGWLFYHWLTRVNNSFYLNITIQIRVEWRRCFPFSSAVPLHSTWIDPK